MLNSIINQGFSVILTEPLYISGQVILEVLVTQACQLSSSPERIKAIQTFSLGALPYL